MFSWCEPQTSRASPRPGSSGVDLGFALGPRVVCSGALGRGFLGFLLGGWALGPWRFRWKNMGVGQNWIMQGPHQVSGVKFKKKSKHQLWISIKYQNHICGWEMRSDDDYFLKSVNTTWGCIRTPCKLTKQNVGETTYQLILSAFLHQQVKYQLNYRDDSLTPNDPNGF